ncbi:MAG: Maf family protein [Pseudolabrys sp.]
MTLWLAPLPLVLASNSEARRKMLADTGIALEIKPANIDERAVEMENNPSNARDAATLLAREKAFAVSRQAPQRIVLGADQTLSSGERRFSKPANLDAAREQLRALSGNTHELHCAAAIVIDGEMLFDHADTARLTMRSLSDAFIDRYLKAAGVAVTHSVGAYQIEGAGAHLFDRIEGDYFSILGLPLLPVLKFLRRHGLIAE